MDADMRTRRFIALVDADIISDDEEKKDDNDTNEARRLRRRISESVRSNGSFLTLEFVSRSLNDFLSDDDISSLLLTAYDFRKLLDGYMLKTPLDVKHPPRLPRYEMLDDEMLRIMQDNITQYRPQKRSHESVNCQIERMEQKMPIKCYVTALENVGCLSSVSWSVGSMIKSVSFVKPIEWSDIASQKCPSLTSIGNVRIGEYKKEKTDTVTGVVSYDIIKCSSVPDTVTHLRDVIMAGQLLPGMLPSGLTFLSFKSFFSLKSFCNLDLPLEARCIPESVMQLHFSPAFLNGGQPFTANQLPPRLTHLTVNFPSIRLGVLPRSLTHLTLSTLGCVDSDENKLPHGITDLVLGGCSGQELKRVVIPETVNHLRLCDEFANNKRPLAHGVLPSSISHLEIIAPSFNNGGEPLECDVLPSGLQYLHLAGGFSSSLAVGALSHGLKTLKFGGAFSNRDTPMTHGQLPSTLTHLEFVNGFSNGYKPLTADVLPSSLQHLTFGFGFTNGYTLLQPGVLPSSLTHVKLGSQYECQLLPGAIPSNVTDLELGIMFNNGNRPLVRGVIPSSVTHLVFGEKFNNTLTPDSIPMSVTHLTFGSRFNNGGRPLTRGLLPSSLMSLKFGEHFTNCDQPLIAGDLPDGLLKLTFGHKFVNGTQPFVADALPASLKMLVLPHLRGNKALRAGPAWAKEMQIVQDELKKMQQRLMNDPQPLG